MNILSHKVLYKVCTLLMRGIYIYFNYTRNYNYRLLKMWKEFILSCTSKLDFFFFKRVIYFIKAFCSFSLAGLIHNDTCILIKTYTEDGIYCSCESKDTNNR